MPPELPPSPRFRLRLPRHQRQHTLLTAAYGAILLLWLSLEDSSPALVSVLGAGAALLLLGLLLLRWRGGRSYPLRLWLPAAPGLGALVGVAAAGSTAGLMLFKNGWHAHASPDFPAEMLLGVLARMPAWAGAGACLAGAAGLLVYALHSDWR